MWIQWRLQICVFVPEGWCNSLWFLRLTEVRRGQNFVKINICLAEESLFGVKLMILVKITHSSTPRCCSLCQSWDNFHHLDSLLAGLFLLFVVNIISARLVLFLLKLIKNAQPLQEFQENFACWSLLARWSAEWETESQGQISCGGLQQVSEWENFMTYI